MSNKKLVEDNVFILKSYKILCEISTIDMDYSTD